MYSPSIRRALLRTCVVQPRVPAVCSRHRLPARLLSTAPTSDTTSATERVLRVGDVQEPDSDLKERLAAEVFAVLDDPPQALDKYSVEIKKEGIAEVEQEQKPEHEMNMDPRSSYRAILHLSGAKDLPTVLSAIQETERKYGRIRDYWITLDLNDPTICLQEIHITFESPESLDRISERTFHGVSNNVFSLPPVNWDRTKLLEGGISLDDMLEYIREADVGVSAEGNEKEDAENQPSEVSASEENMSSSEVEGDLNSSSTMTDTPDANPESSSSNAAEAAEENGLDELAASEPQVQPVSVPELNIGREVTCKIRAHDQSIQRFFEPVRFLNNSFSPMQNREKISVKRERIARCFLAWGGFHPGYTFQNESALQIDELDSDANTKIVADASVRANDPSNAEEARNRAMRAAMIRQRLYLKRAGASNIGLITLQDGQTHVEEWLALQNKGDQEIGSQGGVFGLGTKDASESAEEYEELEEPEKPVELTPEEEASFSRLKERLAKTSPKIAEALRLERQQSEKAAATTTAMLSKTLRSKGRVEKGARNQLNKGSGAPIRSSASTTTPSLASEASPTAQTPPAESPKPRRRYTPPQTDDFVMPVQQAMSEEKVRVRQHVRAGKRKERAQGFRERLLGWVRDL